MRDKLAEVVRDWRLTLPDADTRGVLSHHPAADDRITRLISVRPHVGERAVLLLDVAFVPVASAVVRADRLAVGAQRHILSLPGQQRLLGKAG